MVLGKRRCRPRPARHLDSGCHSDETVRGPWTCRPRHGIAPAAWNRVEMDHPNPAANRFSFAVML
jgi:hypothetical protein